MRHIITGGSGFTGKVLAKNLIQKGQKVVNFDLKNYDDEYLKNNTEYVQGDIRSLNDIQKLNLTPDDIVYHLAARQFADAVPKKGRKEWFFEVNVQGTKNILEEMDKAGTTKMVFFSTDMTYGVPDTCPVSTNHPQRPLGPYGESKVAAEQLIRSYPKLNATIFRPRLITGAGRLGILGKLFKLISMGLPVPMIGNGLNRYQMVSVEDCAKAAEIAMEKGFPRKAYNLGSANPPTTKELLHAIVNHAGSKSIVISTPAGALKLVLSLLDKLGLTLLYPEQFGIADKNILLDTSETINELGWAPSKSDIDAMCEAYDNFRSLETK